MRTEVYTIVQVALSLCTINCTELLDPVTMGICQEKILLTMRVCPMKKLEMLRLILTDDFQIFPGLHNLELEKVEKCLNANFF